MDGRNLVTLYAHTTAGTIDQIGALPALWLGPTRWHDWRGDPDTWATQPADWGWQPVVETPRPADTETTTSDPAPVALVAGVPTQQWAVRPWTAEELAAQAAAAQQDADRLAVRQIINDLRAEKARAQVVIDTPNATINTSPAPHIKDVARAAKRIADAAIDLARFVAP